MRCSRSASEAPAARETCGVVRSATPASAYSRRPPTWGWRDHAAPGRHHQGRRGRRDRQRRQFQPARAAAAWTGRSTARPGRELLRRVPARWAAARPATRSSPARASLPVRHVIHTVGPVWRGGSQRRAGAAGLVLPALDRTGGRARATRGSRSRRSRPGVYGYPLDAGRAGGDRRDARGAGRAPGGRGSALLALRRATRYARSRPRCERRGERPADAGGVRRARSASPTRGRRRCTWSRRWTACPRCAAS